MTFFITGITGKVGGAAARRLLDQGHGVRALVRDPSKAEEWLQSGVEIVEGDLNDAGAVAAGLRGGGRGVSDAAAVLCSRAGLSAGAGHHRRLS